MGQGLGKTFQVVLEINLIFSFIDANVNNY